MGYSEKELHNKKFKDFTHPSDLDADVSQVKRLLDGEIQTFSMEKRYFRKNKSIVWTNLTVSLVRNEDGTPSYFIGAIKDITAKKTGEIKLEKTKDELQKKVSELEKFTDLVVDRELKMIELKKKIAKLEKEKLK